MSRTLRPPVPVEVAAGCVLGVSRTTVVVSPVEITSVAIRTAPMTSTIRPPSTPARRLVSGLLVVMSEGFSAPTLRFDKCAPRPARDSRTGRTRRERHQPAQPVHDAAARELSADNPALPQTRRVRSARVIAVGPQRLRVGLRSGSREATKPALKAEQGGRGRQIPAKPQQRAAQLGQLDLGELLGTEAAQAADAAAEQKR